MITESVKCGRCKQWFEREIEEDREIEEEGKVEEYLCPKCDDEIRKKNKKET